MMEYLDIKSVLVLILLTSFVVNGLITLLDKWNVLETIQGRAKNKFISDLFGCYFCLSFHLSWLFVIPSIYFNENWIELFVPLAVAGIINKIN